LSRKILEYSKEKINKNDVKSLIAYDFSEVFHNLSTGNWSEDCYNDKLMDQGLSIGELYTTASCHVFHGQISIERGNTNAQRIVDKLSEITDIYDNDYAKEIKFRLRTLFLIKYRKLHEALLEAASGIDFFNKTGTRPIRLVVYSLKARIQILLGDLNAAKDSLQIAERFLTKENYFLINFVTSQFVLKVVRLEEAIKNGNGAGIVGHRKSILRAGKWAVKVSRKAAQDRVEIYKLMGIYYWLFGKQNRALKWWRRSIDEGIKLGAKLELSRTYFEIGKRLLESKSRYHLLDGISAEVYLDKAKNLFREMDLSWDLNELKNLNREGCE
jgi:hypothetical protein